MLRLAALITLLATSAMATCKGNDLRATLNADERQHLMSLVTNVPYPTGNHWRAERDGQVIHLIGTLHVDDPRLDAPTDLLRNLVGGAGRLLVESDASAERALRRAMTDQPELLLLPETTLPQILDEDGWTRLSQAVSDRGLPPFMAARFRPWYLSVLLSVPPCANAAATDPQARGMDKRLMDIAASSSVPIMALEPFDTVFRLFESVPLDIQLGMLQAAVAAPDMTEDLLATAAASYFDENHAEAWAMSRVLAHRMAADTDLSAVLPVMQDVLLDRRNRAWIPVILQAAETTDGAPLVAAFGAAHLFGDAGVLQLLENEGFTLTRQPFTAP